jgi:magnesium-transporting ATPase (P-type)
MHNQSRSSNLTDKENQLEFYLVFLSLCHTIIIDAKTGKFNASSPDELALVNAAKQFGYSFVGRDGDNICTVMCNNVERKYLLLNILEFTSTRKR